MSAGQERAALRLAEWASEVIELEPGRRDKRLHASTSAAQRVSALILDQRAGITGRLAAALGNAHDQREFIRRCTDGRFEINNGRVERAIREPAIGRRNFLFTGSLAAGKRLAAAYTLVQSCRALGLSGRATISST